MATGEIAIDFGAGAEMVSVAISRSTVTASTHVEAYLFPKATADHTVDEHLIDGPEIWAHSISSQEGFTITGRIRDGHGDRLTGLWNVRWVSTE